MPARRTVLLLWTLWLLSSATVSVASEELTLAQVQRVFPNAQTITMLNGKAIAYLVRSDRAQLGYAFVTDDLARISAYSGKPINTLIGLGLDGRISAVEILHHEEPILVVGISDADLKAFVDQFIGKKTTDRVRVGARGREGYVGIDGISGATITTMVLATSVNKSVKQVADAYGIPRSKAPAMSGMEVDSTGAVFEDLPAWRLVWEDRAFEIVILLLALILLMAILFFQDWLVERADLFRRVRVTYLLFTVFFIGFYCSAQLSVVNLLAFFQSLSGGFSWDTLLIEPAVFLLWAFVAISILLWGRGVYCGWLCPFGAAQDLISKLATRLGFENYHLPQMVHERLWAIKYFILMALVGLSLDSMVHVARLVEVEPFKTVFILRFMRDPMFVVYAVALLAVSAFNSKFYCKYLCPMGAALSFATRFRIFDWLRRRRECGKPCQSCAHQCQISAFKPTGEIIDNECHYCLECQVSYWDENRCPPLVEKRKKREARKKKAVDLIASSPE
ncbi:MAG: 4Fe-4S binding protein [Halieaceae bacterium]|jgi:NosR/NirI family transcriptional regulator, nitrous oxide reductase regulator|nr:4Fe-4S binding protein [Halieaceae bacterium]